MIDSLADRVGLESSQLRRACLNGDSSKTHPQVDTTRSWMLCSIEPFPEQVLPVGHARKIRHDLANSTFGVNRVCARTRKHHQDVTAAHGRFNVSTHVAYRNIAFTVVNHQTRVPRRVNIIVEQYTSRLSA